MTEKEFTSLVPELRQTALHVCRGCGTDGMTAEDVAQDTMLRLWAIRKDITSAQHAKGLTGCVAKHFCIDRHRKKREVSLLLHPHLQAESHEAPPVTWIAQTVIDSMQQTPEALAEAHLQALKEQQNEMLFRLYLVSALQTEDLASYNDEDEYGQEQENVK